MKKINKKNKNNNNDKGFVLVLFKCIVVLIYYKLEIKIQFSQFLHF